MKMAILIVMKKRGSPEPLKYMQSINEVKQNKIVQEKVPTLYWLHISN